MRRTGIVCACMLLGLATASASELDGTWEGTTGDGAPVVWQVEGGRVRIDGRPADLEIRSDSLVVRFDAPLLAGRDANREIAIYRFLLSGPRRDPARLFVYGFDLGARGVRLVRTSGPPPLPEDAAPPVPEGGAAGGQESRPTPVPGPQARSNER